MAEQPQQTEPKRKAGSIRQYATLGRGKTSEHQDTQESEHPGVTTSKRSNAQESEHPGTKTPKRERHTIYLPPDLSEWVKIRAVKTKREISELATEALEQYRANIESE